MISELEGHHGVSGVRFALAVVTLFGALFLLLGAEVAHADPSFVLTESGAGSGDRVHFSISGTESRATYSLEVDGEGVGEGSVPAGGGVSGEFTMPDLGNTSQAVTVEAEIKQSDETTTQARKLQYLASSQASTGPAGPQPTPVLTSTPAAQSATVSLPPRRSNQRKRPASRPAPGKRRARRSPRRAHEQHASLWQPFARAGDRPRRRRSPVSAPPTRASAPFATPSSEAKPLSTAKPQNRPPSGRDESVGPLTTFLTAPPAPVIFSLASGVASSSSGDPPVAAAIVLLLLGLTALTFAGGGLAPKRRPARPKRRSRSRVSQGADPFVSARRRPAPAPAPVEDWEAAHILLQEAVASFAPIPLAMLDQQATLATRSERKYVLDTRTFERLMGEFSPHYLILEIDEARVFPYDTVYFDTSALTTYRQHVQERRRRFKCRTRLYAASGPCFFEVKLKGGRGETIKRRLELGVEEHGSLTRPALTFLEHELQEAYGASPPGPLGPVLRTAYRRLTLVGRTSSERLTFDFELMFAANGKEYSIQPGRILLETKADVGAGEASGEANRVLRRLGVRPVGSCSKYCLGVALAHPELPDNPFRPLIRHYFDAQRHVRTRPYDRSPVAPPAVELEREQPVTPTLPAWQEGTA